MTAAGSSSTTRASIVIAARNEESVIHRCLSSVLSDATPNEFEIVVAVNGSSDRTLEIAQSFDGVISVEVEQASKSDALNAADAIASVWPRVYLDADVIVSTDAIRATCALLDVEGVRCAAPSLHVDTTGCGPFVRAWVRAYMQTPWVADDLVGSGLYALDEAAHQSIGRFPDLIADDLFVARSFDRSQRVSVEGAEFTVPAPRTLRDLVRTKARVAYGNMQFDRVTKTSANQQIAQVQRPMASRLRVGPTRTARKVRTAIRMANKPSMWIPLAVYTAVYATTRSIAIAKIRLGVSQSWQRDESTRKVRTI